MNEALFEKLKIWQCGCGGYNSAGRKTCGMCGKSRPDIAGGHAEPEPAAQGALVDAVQGKAEVFGADARLVVTIERLAPRLLDYDNFVGGCKQLRDAVAEALGRKGDAETDGLEFEYTQKKAKMKMTIITIREADDD